MSEGAIEAIVDQIYELTDQASPAIALGALTAVIMGTTDRCDEPPLALLAVIAALTDLARFRDGQGVEYKASKVPSLLDWIKEAWKEFGE